MIPISHLEPGRPARRGQLILERRRRIVLDASGQSGMLGRMLDIGCGNGAQTAVFSDAAGEIYGLDIIPLGDTENPDTSGCFRFIRGAAADLPFQDASFDTVTAFEVFEHLPDDLGAAREAWRTLKDDGRLVITVPNRWWIFETHGARLRGFNWLPWNRVPFISWLPTSVHDRIAMARIYTMSQAVKLVTDAGFEVSGKGYVTAPLDVLKGGLVSAMLRKTIFRGDTTRIPLLAVNLFVACRKQSTAAVHYNGQLT